MAIDEETRTLIESVTKVRQYSRRVDARLLATCLIVLEDGNTSALDERVEYLIRGSGVEPQFPQEVEKGSFLSVAGGDYVMSARSSLRDLLAHVVKYEGIKKIEASQPLIPDE